MFCSIFGMFDIIKIEIFYKGKGRFDECTITFREFSK